MTDFQAGPAQPVYIIDDSQLVENGGTFLVSGRRAVAITTDGSITSQWLTAAQGAVPDGADVASQDDVTNAQIAAQDYAVTLVDDLSGVTDEVGAAALSFIGLAAAPIAPIRNATVTVLGANPAPMDYIGDRLYGFVAPATLHYSDNDGTSWTLLQVTGLADTLRTIWARPDGEVLLHGSNGIYVSTGWATNPVTATWTTTLTPNGVSRFLNWGIDVYGSKVIATEYAVNPRDDSENVYVSLDAGDTWVVALSLSDLYPGQEANYHWHGICYDPWADRFWATFGDSTAGAYYSDDDGATWTLLSSTVQFTTCAASVQGVTFGTDSSTQQGLWTVKRATPLAYTLLYDLRATQATYGFTVRAIRNPRTHHVYHLMKSDYAGYAAYILGSPDGLSGSEVYEATAGVLAWVNLCVNGAGTKLTGYYTVSAVNYLFQADVPGVGVKNELVDTGNVTGGTSTQQGVAVGRRSASGNRGVAVGTGATALDRGVAVGRVAAAADLSVAVGESAASSAAYGTAIGRSAAAGNSATAIGTATTAVANSEAFGYGADGLHANSVALGKDTQTQATNQVAVGERDVEIQDAARGVILRDTNGVRYRVTVSTAGALVVTAL